MNKGNVLANVFHPIDGIESDLILQVISFGTAKVTARCSNGSFLQLMGTGAHETNSVIMKELGKQKFISALGQMATVSILHDRRKYLVSAFVLPVAPNLFRLEFTQKFHLVQRRQVQRLDLPKNYYSVLKADHVDSRLIRKYFRVCDIGPGGIGLVLDSKTPDFSVGQIVKGELLVHQKFPVRVAGRIQHISPINEEGNPNYAKIGLKLDINSRRDATQIGDLFNSVNRLFGYKKSA